MNFITKGKTNWKYILIIIVVAAITAGGILAYQYMWPVGEVEKEETVQDETANWQIYSFSVQELRIIKEQLTPEKQEELEKKIRDQRLEDCSFEIKYPQDWTVYTWPLHGVIVPAGLFIEEDPKNHNGCSFQMSFRGDPEKEKYCFPISLSSGESNQEQCDNIFNQMFSTFKFIKVNKIEEIQKIEVKSETDHWETYTNEKYGLEFEYPKDWEALTFDSQKTDELYIFNSHNETIGMIYYHKPSGVTAFIEKGEKYDLAWNGGKDYQDILKIIGSDKEIKTIFTISPDWVSLYGKIGGINFSPNGKYIAFIFSAYEYSKPMLFNIENGVNILSSNIFWFGDIDENIYWSSNNKVLIIKNEVNDFSGQGSYSIFVSDYGVPDKLNKIFEIDYNEVRSSPRKYISDLYIINDEKVYFSVFLAEWNSNKRDYDILKKTKYEYSVKTKGLKEIE